MSLLSLSKALLGIPDIEKVFTHITSGGCPVAVSGLSYAHKAHLAAAVRRLTGRPVVFLCPDESEPVRLAGDLAALTGESCTILPSREYNFHPVETVSREWEQARMWALYQMTARRAGVVAAPIDAFMQRALPPAVLSAHTIKLTPGQQISPEKLLAALLAIGYRRCELLEGVGQIAVRGGIVDIYPAGETGAVRLEFFGDEIDTLSAMDVDTQRRIAPLSEVTVLPVMEAFPAARPGGAAGLAEAMETLYLTEKKRRGAPPALLAHLEQDRERLQTTGWLLAPDRYLALLAPTFCTALSYLPANAIIFISELSRVKERMKHALWQMTQDTEALLENGLVAPQLARWLWEPEELWAALAPFDTVFLDSFTPSGYDLRPRGIYAVSAKQLPCYGGSLETAENDIRHYCRESYATVALCPTEMRARNLAVLLQEKGIDAQLDPQLLAIPAPGTVRVAVGALSAGLEYPGLRLAVIAEGNAPVVRKRRAGKSGDAKNRRRIHSYTDLKPGDLVVHDHHGIGRFVRVEKMQYEGVERDYLRLAYAGTDTLFVPVTKLHLISKYIGAGEESSARLHKLHSAEWQKAKVRAKAAAKDLAQGLIALYAARKRRPGFAFPADNDWQSGFEAAFPYEETEDQLRCTAEIKADMQVDTPMDRLLCGDVGFGKTEVALRAVMKCVLGGKQAAFLVPTTVLAQQHYETAVRRFVRYPVRVEVLSRFRTPAQMRDSLKKIQSGAVDLVIGTHRLLQKDVRFHDLGLLIVDEEQRFGVTHKERLKEIARQVDVLTLTATPIPRTLNMALSGIRDMSTIEEAPRDRVPVQTYVLEHDWGLLADAIRREVSRGGQVYYLHNRVETIERTAARLGVLLPDVNIDVAHGQMDEQALGDVMRRCFHGELQVLVCTTIIETGIDIPNVNTLIVEDADKLGLAQLHQIRGRVGRSPRHAFAYLCYRKGKILSEVATKRLSAIREFAEFGSGFKIAMRDLEIRGAGDVLGAEQHGHMVSVGYDMYLRLLEEAVLEEKGEPEAARPVDCSADLAVSAGIPEKYVPSAGQRIDLYRRIAAIADDEDAETMLDELIDRFGDPPPQVDALVQIARLRAEAGRYQITELQQKGARLHVKMASPDFASISRLCARPEYKGRLLFSAGSEPGLTLRLVSGTPVLKEARALVAAYGEAGEGHV